MRSGSSSPVSVRFSPEELAQVRESAEQLGLPVSVFIRGACLGRRPRARPDGETREAIHQLVRVGLDLTRLAHWASANEHLRSLRQIEDVLGQVRRKIEEHS